MAAIVGVQFQKNGKIYNYDVGNLEISQNDYVIADTPHGLDLGQVTVLNNQDIQSEGVPPLKKIVRIATDKDLRISAENREKEKEAFSICQKKIAEHKLDMKLVSVEYAFDNSKALFYFTANGRVDFRSLVKDLASVFKMRIELRQIGVRDEARMIGGLGPCGLQICCGSFLDEFQPVSIKMAKEQNLSLNPTKISGVCGRLMCCLKYEQDHYEQARKVMPRIGKEVVTPDGNGIVSDLNILKESVFVRITNGDSSEIKEYPLDMIQKVAPVPQPQTRMKDDSASDSCESREPSNDNKGGSADHRKTRPESGARNDHPGNLGNTVASKNKDARRQEKNDNPKRSAVLGKPVMRENTNKSQKPAVAAPSEKPAEKKEPASNWAEAVKKAMDSIS